MSKESNEELKEMLSAYLNQGKQLRGRMRWDVKGSGGQRNEMAKEIRN
jgi:hypothetical protein